MLWIDEKYLNEISPTLQMFKKKRAGLWNCRCPKCGDSEKSKLKARGYFYVREGKMFYRCHNCGASETLASFLWEWDRDAHKRYKMENFKEEHGNKTKKVKQIKEPEYKFKRKEFDKAPDLLEENAELIADLPPDHEAVTYLKDRQIPEEFHHRLYYVEMLADISSKIEKYKNEKYDAAPRIIIPSFNADKELTHLAARAIGPSTMRYMTLTVKDDALKVYGMDRVDTSKPVYVLEGQFDSMFIPNAVAMGGSDLDSNFLDNAVYIFDNEPRSKQIMLKVQRLIDKGKHVVIWGKTPGKDVNSMIENGMTKEQVFEHIKDHTFYGPRAKLKFTEYRKG